MIRLIIENIVLFLLPTAVYAIYVAATRTDSRKGIWDGAPLALLMVIGAVLMVAVLALFGKDTRGKPGEVYIPPQLGQDGGIAPAEIKERSKDDVPQWSPK